PRPSPTRDGRGDARFRPRFRRNPPVVTGERPERAASLSRAACPTVGKRLLALDDRGTGRGHLPVERHELRPRFGDVVLVKNRIDGALRDTRLAINALLRIDEQHPFSL